jgi:hypothetical protein
VEERSDIGKKLLNVIFANAGSIEYDIPEFQIVQGGTIRQAEKLISREGYSYGKDGRPNKSGAQRWRCTVRNAVIVCSASVRHIH